MYLNPVLFHSLNKTLNCNPVNRFVYMIEQSIDMGFVWVLCSTLSKVYFSLWKVTNLPAALSTLSRIPLKAASDFFQWICLFAA